MCGRYETHSPREIAGAILKALSVEPPADWGPRFNIAPTQPVLVVVSEDGGNRAAWMRWGLVPWWSKKATSRWINARSETADQQRPFRKAFERQRCIVLANGFYEWAQKEPWRVHFTDQPAIAMAGIWDRWKSPEGEVIESVAILTCAANERVALFHDRMPVVLRADPSAWERWLSPDARSMAELQDLLVPYPAELTELQPVSRRLGKVSIDEPSLLVPDAQQLDLFRPLEPASDPKSPS